MWDPRVEECNWVFHSLRLQRKGTHTEHTQFSHGTSYGWSVRGNPLRKKVFIGQQFEAARSMEPTHGNHFSHGSPYGLSVWNPNVEEGNWVFNGLIV